MWVLFTVYSINCNLFLFIALMFVFNVLHFSDDEHGDDGDDDDPDEEDDGEDADNGGDDEKDDDGDDDYNDEVEYGDDEEDDDGEDDGGDEEDDVSTHFHPPSSTVESSWVTFTARRSTLSCRLLILR